jgi:hypothetical protein
MTLILSESLIQNTVKYFYRELGGWNGESVSFNSKNA